MEGTVCNEGGAGTRCVMGIGGMGGGCRVREALRARAREDERGGTLPGGMLYILQLLWSAGLDGDGVLEGRPRCADLPPLLSMLIFLSGSRFSATRVSMLGRCDAIDGLRDISVRDALHGTWFSENSLCGTVSARLGSVISRMSDRGRFFAQDGTLLEWPLGSPKVLATMPPQPTASDPGDATYAEPPVLSSEGRASDGGPFPGGGCECPDPFSIRPARSVKVKGIPSAALLCVASRISGTTPRKTE